MSVAQRIERIHSHLLQRRQRLETLSYRFQRPDAALPGPNPQVNQALVRLEREVGCVPLALQLFYRRIGSVNFAGQHPEWKGCEYPDPLVVFPVAFVLEELEVFLGDREAHVEAFGGFRLPIAPDRLHKANVSGGMHYNIALPDVAEDPRLLDEWHNSTFLSYLEIALRYGGFPGLERWCYQEHDWPIVELTKGFVFDL